MTASSGKRWTIYDLCGNPIYLTDERWSHIIDKTNHFEMESYEAHLKTTIRKGKRWQEPLNPRKYRYSHLFRNRPDDVNHIVAIVMFGFDVDAQGQVMPNNFIATAFFKHIQLRGSS